LGVLLDLSETDAASIAGQKAAAALLANREGRIDVTPGFDGEYGVPQLP